MRRKAIVAGMLALLGAYQINNTDKLHVKDMQIEKSSQNTSELYGENIESTADTAYFLEHRNGEVPKDLPTNKFKSKDKEKLGNIIYSTMKELGYDKAKLKELDFQEAIDLATTVDTTLMDYELVDNSGFARKHGFNLPIETYMELGKGDCDKYTDGFIATFNLIKNLNENLDGIYATHQINGVSPGVHDWVNLITFSDGTMKIMNIEPQGGSLENNHLTENENILKGSLYQSLSNTKHSNKYLDQALAGESEFADSLDIYNIKAVNAWADADVDAIEDYREKVKDICNRQFMPGVWQHYYENVLFYSITTHEAKLDKLYESKESVLTSSKVEDKIEELNDQRKELYNEFNEKFPHSELMDMYKAANPVATYDLDLNSRK
ncbi:MAG: hypothetical protein ACLFTH_04425 [Candidatus Woesearchaeota archaeon]